MLSANGTRGAINKYHEVKDIFKKAAMNIREFLSNDQNFNKAIPKQDKIEGVPIMIQFKLFLQNLWKRNNSWDQIVDKDDKEAWRSLTKEWLADIIEIPRLATKKLSDQQLHVFTDASSVAYSAVVYILNKHVDERNSAIFFAKSRLAPIKGMIIPRLKLLAILTGVRAANKQLCYKVIEYGKNRSGVMVEFEMCITLDTKSIEITTQIHTKPSKRNMKDIIEIPRLATKKLSDQQLHVFTDASSVAYSAVVYILNKHVDERNSAIFFAKSRLAPIKGMIIPRLKLLAILTGVRAANKQLCYKVIEYGKNRSGVMVEFEMCITLDTKSIEITTQIHTKPSKRNMKGKFFISICTKATKRLSPVKLRQYKLWWEGPSWLTGPESGWPQWEHQSIEELKDKEERIVAKVASQTIEVTQFSLIYGSRFSKWSKLVRTTVWALKFIKLTTKGEQTARAANVGQLSHLNYQLCPIFLNHEFYFKTFAKIGLDYFGPISIKIEVGVTKRWITLFTCFTRKAVHLETVENLSAESFLHVLRRFISRQGYPGRVLSDNASQFQVVFKPMKEQEHTRIGEFLAEKGMVWENITPRAPWSGGLYKRLIGLIKKVMRRAIGRKLL
ncbi:pao retrotransposon peptidase [Loa loa]|uniref:Pao retrotransposon peptidase n=1 Tax=Loa loa TaxID=7209 RepID=A0A1S0ULM4_LOALO|nr:pao retrotransposon peptidase [Loa loa]EJD76485.1 pao retrotransposon peptidase [Loa loa]